MRKLLYGLILLAAAIPAVWLIVLDRQGRLVWDHWDEAKRGVLYRSGQLTGDQLTAAIKRNGIRTVINLQMPGDELAAERDLARSSRRRLRELADARRWFWRGVAIPRDPQDHRRSPAAPRAGPLCPGHVPDRCCRGALPLRARRLDARRRRGRDAAANVSLWLAAGLHLRHGEEQTGVGRAAARDDRRPQPGGGFVARRCPTDWQRRPSMSLDPAFIRAAHRLKLKTTEARWRLRLDHRRSPRSPGARLIMVGLALFFVILGAINLDLGSGRSTTGTGGRRKTGAAGPGFRLLGARFVAGTSHSQSRARAAGGVRPAQLGGRTLAGCIGRNHRRMDDRAEHGQGPWAARWRSFWDLLVRQPGADRSIGRNWPGPDRRVGHAGVDRPAHHARLRPGCRTMGRTGVSGRRMASTGSDRPGDHRHRQVERQIFSRACSCRPLATAILWSFWTVWASSAEVWAATLTLPLTQKPAWMLGLQVVALGLPWSPFAILLLSRSVRDGWKSDGRSWLIGWLQVVVGVPYQSGRSCRV